MYFGRDETRKLEFLCITLFPYSLSSIFALNRTLDIASVLKIGVQLVDIIKSIHGYGYIHGDLNTANIMLSDYNEVNLVDFGCASRWCSKSGEPYSDESLEPYTGTPLYSSIGRLLSASKNILLNN